VSYEELDARAERLARRLKVAGVGAETPVGVLLERSTETVVALLAALKAGGVYIPLDPGYPAARLQFIAEDVKLRVLVTRRGLPALRAGSVQSVIYVDDAADTPLQGVAHDLADECSADSLAYVMYTSGSTGRPKGVGVTHRNVIRLLYGVDYVKLGAGRTLLQLAPVTFDASTFEIWGALLHGGTLVIAPHDNLTFEELGELIRRERVDTLWLTSSLYNAVIDQSPSALRGVGQLLIGGEALSPAHVRRGLSLLPGTQIINGYGPTEGTTFTCCYPIPAGFDPQATSVPIGKPIANTRVYILDAYMNPLAVGVKGELYIGGDGLARGYLGRPHLTAQKFVPDPFGDGDRLYRTGDVARWRAEGEVEFLGRADQQVKLRGFRIELGEIEAALCSHAGVREAAALVREDAPGDKRLVAYYVMATGAEVTAGELRGHLSGLLPDYMVPSTVVLLDSLPLTPNGKLDRQALPAPGEARPDSEFEVPRTPAEEIVCGLFAHLLGVARVGADDNFFELGGHSLLAMQTVSRLRLAFGVEVALRSLFEAPTPRLLAHIIEAARTGEGDVTAPPPLRRLPRHEGELLPASFAQQRLWFIQQLDPDSAAYNIPFAARLSGPLDAGAFERMLTEVVRRHEVLRTTFMAVDGQPVQIISPPSPFPLPVLSLEHLPEAEREAAARAQATDEARLRFDLSQGPLLRVRLLRLAPDDQVVLFTMHHIISDGWSTGVLVREVAALYEAYRRGAESPLEELSVQYADYAVWQREWLQGEALDEQLSYWRGALEGAPGVLELPTDRARPAVQSWRGASERVELGVELSAGLRALSRAEGTTLFMTLLAGWQALLYRLSGQADVVVGTDVANRGRVETEEMIGFFINQLVLRTSLSGNPTFKQLLGRVRRTVLGAYTHLDLPFHMLVEHLRPERALSHNPLFQVLFVLHEQNAFVEADGRVSSFELEDLKATPVAVPVETATFDLSFHVWQEDGQIAGSLRYNTDLFDASRIIQIAADYRFLLGQIVATPDARIEELSEMLSEAGHAEQLRKVEELEQARLRKLVNLRRRALV